MPSCEHPTRCDSSVLLASSREKHHVIVQCAALAGAASSPPLRALACHPDGHQPNTIAHTSHTHPKPIPSRTLALSSVAMLKLSSQRFSRYTRTRDGRPPQPAHQSDIPTCFSSGIAIAASMSFARAICLRCHPISLMTHARIKDPPLCCFHCTSPDAHMVEFTPPLSHSCCHPPAFQTTHRPASLRALVRRPSPARRIQ